MAEKTFESQMARLEEIVRLLERGEAPLAESMKLFEEGTKLSATEISTQQLFEVVSHDRVSLNHIISLGML